MFCQIFTIFRELIIQRNLYKHKIAKSEFIYSVKNLIKQCCIQHCPTQDTTEQSQELDPSWIEEFCTACFYAHNHIHHKQ